MSLTDSKVMYCLIHRECPCCGNLIRIERPIHTGASFRMWYDTHTSMDVWGCYVCGEAECMPALVRVAWKP